MEQLIAACRRAQHDWARLSVRERLRPIRRFRQSLVAACDELCAAVKHEVGRSAEETLGADILPLADACKFLECEAASLLKPRRVKLRSTPLWLLGQRDTIHRRPHGVVGIIGTWNYPLFLNGGQIAQALIAGNGVLWKPSEVSTASAPLLHELFLKAGVPGDLLQLLSANRQVGAELVEADVDHIVFTGSAAVGRKIAARLGERLVSSTLELSGCDAMFVLADADVEMAAKAAWFGTTINRGQTCIAVRRAFVQKSIYPRFVEEIQKRVAEAAPMELAMRGQVQQAERLVSDAVSKGGRLLTGARETMNPRECLPRVIADAKPDMALCREDCFAPLMAVLPYDSLDDALRMDAECRYGLGSSIFTGDTKAAREFAVRLRTGSVSINDVVAPTAHPATPFGGRGHSGWGVTQGPDGLLSMTVPQVVSVRGGNFRPHYEPTGGPVCGPSGAGKTSLAYYCARNGWTYVSDNESWLVGEGDGQRLLGNPQRIRFRGDARELFPELGAFEPALDPNGKMSIAIEPTDIDIAYQCAVEKVVVLARQPDGPAAMRSLPGEQVLDRFLSELPLYDSQVRQRQRRGLQTIAELNPVELRYSRLEDALRRLESLLI